MYMRTRDYRRGRRRRGLSLRRLLLWVFAPLIIYGGIHVYNNRDAYQPVVEEIFTGLIRQAEDVVSTAQAPAPTPTNDPTNNVRLASASWESGSIQEAVRLYAGAINALPNDLLAHYRLTYGYIMQGQYELAMEAAENTVTANPFSSDAWAIRALALNRVGRFGESIASALRALEIDRDNARARAFLAESYQAVGATTRAQAELERALSIDPDNVEARYISGRLKWNVQFDFPAAVEELRAAYESSGLTYVGVELSQMYFSSFIDQPQEGLNILLDILDRNPENTAVLYQLGRYYFRTQGDPNQGITYLTRCTNADARSINCHYELGRAQEALERNDEARLSFEKAVELGTLNPYHFWWAGEMELATLGDCTSAMGYFERGYEITNQQIENRIEIYGTFDAMVQLKENYEQSMTPCLAFSSFTFATPLPEFDETLEEPTPEGEASQ
jgi:tetratricopeptide (TPR) repeat protein